MASLLHNVVLVSAVQQHESPPSCSTIPPLPVLYSSLPLTSYFTHGSIHISATFPIRPPLPFASHSPTMSVLTEHQISYILTHIWWNLEKWYRWIYLQSRNRDTDAENKYMDTQGEGGVGGFGRKRRGRSKKGDGVLDGQAVCAEHKGRGRESRQKGAHLLEELPRGWMRRKGQTTKNWEVSA